MIPNMTLNPHSFTPDEQMAIAAWLTENGATGYIARENIHIENGTATYQVLCRFDANGDRAPCDCAATDTNCTREETITLTTPPPTCLTPEETP